MNRFVQWNVYNTSFLEIIVAILNFLFWKFLMMSSVRGGLCTLIVEKVGVRRLRFQTPIYAPKIENAQLPCILKIDRKLL